jgi:hypothetical protein
MNTAIRSQSSMGEALGDHQESQGFTNPDGTTCYRNAILQMLFPLPIFLYWVEKAKESYVGSDGVCSNQKENDESDDEFEKCKLCLLKDLINTFWSPNPNKTWFYSALDEFWRAILRDCTRCSGVFLGVGQATPRGRCKGVGVSITWSDIASSSSGLVFKKS